METTFNNKNVILENNGLPSISYMNREFLIRWKGEKENIGSKLISAGKYDEKFGERYMIKHFAKAVESTDHKTVVKIRGLYEITFIAR